MRREGRDDIKGVYMCDHSGKPWRRRTGAGEEVREGAAGAAFKFFNVMSGSTLIALVLFSMPEDYGDLKHPLPPRFLGRGVLIN